MPLNLAKSETFDRIEKLMRECTGGVASAPGKPSGLFPDDFIHLGGDEVDPHPHHTLHPHTHTHTHTPPPPYPYLHPHARPHIPPPHPAPSSPPPHPHPSSPRQVNTDCWITTPSVASWLSARNMSAADGYAYFVKKTAAFAIAQAV